MPDFRSLPQVDTLSRDPNLQGLPEALRLRAAREAIELARQKMREGESPDVAALAVEVARRLQQTQMTSVINMTGVILHTGVGRARLARSVMDHVADVASRHSIVEFDLESGQRGDRQTIVRDLLCNLTGAEDAVVVNNAAAGVLLSLRAIAGNGEVILSRGQMVEIGGSFRVPDIVRESGCQLIEVGCTNKTHIVDYERALGENTRAILRCHTSNYKVIGFASTPTLAELVQVGKTRGIPVINDQGTGCLIDTSKLGMPMQPTVQESVASGADVTIASGDKMLGGPQAGLILGRKDAIARIKSHPMARAVRVDKMTLAALEATLKLYQEGRQQEIPTIRYLTRPLDDLHAVAMRLAEAYPGEAIVEQGITEVGGGSAPGTGIPTWRVGLDSDDPENLVRELRRGAPHILSRIEFGRVWLDPRTLDAEEEEVVICRLKAISA